jgi:photosystem II stability/assembly factor-like uncharacterized protein
MSRDRVVLMNQKLVPFILLLLCILLIRCSVPQTTTPSSEPELPTHSVEPSATRENPTQPPPKPTFITTIEIPYLRMFDENQGWGIGGILGTKETILRTRDGGLTWTEANPPEPMTSGVSPRPFMIGFFLDPNHAWVRNSHSTRVWRTNDGGQTWDSSELPDIEFFHPSEIFPDTIFFTDSQHGWLIFYLESGMSHQYVNLYRTADGGATWEELVDPTGAGGLQGCCKTGMAFHGLQTGLMTYEQGPYTEAHVSWSHDGGRTWIYQALPSPFTDPDDVQYSYCTTHSPHLFSSETVTLGVECRITSDWEDTYSYVYTSKDAGENWSTMPCPGRSIQFFTQTMGYSFGPDIYKTENSGQTWEFVSTNDWEAEFQFVDLQIGWAITQMEEDRLLYQTTDGGSTWSLIEPRIIYSP